VDHLPFIPPESCNSDDHTLPNMDLTYDCFVKEEIIDNGNDNGNDNDDNGNGDDNDDNSCVKNKPTFIQQPQILKTTPRTVVISPKQSKGQISISKNLSKPVFIPINLSNVKTIKVRDHCLVLSHSIV